MGHLIKDNMKLCDVCNIRIIEGKPSINDVRMSDGSKELVPGNKGQDIVTFSLDGRGIDLTDYILFHEGVRYKILIKAIRGTNIEAVIQEKIK